MMETDGAVTGSGWSSEIGLSCRVQGMRSFNCHDVLRASKSSGRGTTLNTRNRLRLEDCMLEKYDGSIGR